MPDNMPLYNMPDIRLGRWCKVVEDVANFQEALSLLLPQGDFAGALDVCDDLRATLASKELEGLHVARHLPQQLSKATKVCSMRGGFAKCSRRDMQR